MATTSKIHSTGIYVPEETMSNEEFEEITGRDLTGFAEYIGIDHRHLSTEEETPAYMAAEAGLDALDNADMDVEDLDLIIVGTDTPEAVTPPTAIKTQDMMGGSEAEVPAFDVDASCANGSLMLDIASRFIKSGDFENVLVIGTYAMTKMLNWKYQWEALFSDGAAAVLLSETDGPGFVGAESKSDGSWWNNWGIYMGTGTMDMDGINDGLHKLDQRAAFPSEINEEGWPNMIADLKEKYDFENEDIGKIFFTQVRKKSIEKVMDEMALPMEKTHMTMGKFGYTGSACVYQALHDARQNGEMENVESGQKVLFIMSGVGYTQWGTVFEWE